MRVSGRCDEQGEAGFSRKHEPRPPDPLNTTLGFSYGFLEELFGALNEKQEKYLKDVAESGKRLSSLSNDSLNLLNVESRKMDLELCQVSVKESLNVSIMLLKEKDMKRGIRLGCG